MNDAPEVRQSEDSIPRRPFVAVGIGSAIVIAASVVVPLAFVPHGRSAFAARESGPALAVPPGLAQRRAQRESLEKWSWVDRDAGIAQMPISVAIDLALQGAAVDGGGGP